MASWPLARWIVTALAAVVTLLAVPLAAQAKPGERPARPQPKQHQQRRQAHRSSAAVLARLRREVAWHRSHTWRLQDAAQLHRTKSSTAERYTTSAAYLHWLVRLWNQRRLEARRAAAKIERQWRAMSGDFETAVRVLANRLHLGTRMAEWVLSCADSEGGRGAWVPNHGGSGAGGWMQFLSGTYYNNSPAAWKFAAARGVVVPRRHNSWYSPVGQALTALYMFSVEGSGQWYGSGC